MSLRILFQKTRLNSTRRQFDGRHQIHDIGFQNFKRVFTAVAKGELRALSSLTCLWNKIILMLFKESFFLLFFSFD